jgi:hypothetical protein
MNTAARALVDSILKMLSKITFLMHAHKNYFAKNSAAPNPQKRYLRYNISDL